MGIDPKQKTRDEEFQARLREQRAKQSTEQDEKGDKAKVLATNKKNLDVARRHSGTATIVFARRDAGKVDLLIGDNHDPKLLAKIAAEGVHGHIDVTEHGVVATQNVQGPAFEAAMKQITPAKVSYKRS